MNLRSYINPSLSLEIKNQTLILEGEFQHNLAMPNITIKNIPKNAFAFSLEKTIPETESEAHNEFLGNVNAIKETCSAVLVCQEAEIVYIAICEFNAHLSPIIKYENKLVNVHLFLDYILNLYHTFNKVPIAVVNMEHFIFYASISKKNIKIFKNIDLENMKLFIQCLHPNLNKHKCTTFHSIR